MTATETTDDLDLGEYSPAAVEKEMESGGRLPPGKYHVALVAVADQAMTSGGVFQTPLTFEVLAGEQKGRRHTERLTEFVQGNSTDAQKKSNNRYLLFASRLGLYDTAGGKYRLLKPTRDFKHCLGAQCIVEIKHEPRRDKVTKQVVAGEPYANITFGGVYTLTDPKMKDVVRGDGAAVSFTQPAAGYDLSTI